MTVRGEMDYEFLKEQFKNLREGQIRLEDKLDLIRDSVDIKVQILTDKVLVQDRQISKNTQTISLATICLTTGLAGIGGFFTFIWNTLIHPR